MFPALDGRSAVDGGTSAFVKTGFPSGRGRHVRVRYDCPSSTNGRGETRVRHDSARKLDSAEQNMGSCMEKAA